MIVNSTKTIDEVTETLIDYRGKTPIKTESGTKLITAKVIKDGFIRDGNHEYIANSEYDAWMRRGLPKQWDILITTEAPLGEVAQLRTNEKVALAQRVILLRGKSHVIDQAYYFQALKSPYVQGELKSKSCGTTVLGIKQPDLRNVRIPYPPLPTQRKIAAILSAYDDLIENNQRRIKILGEMAQNLYSEWFVRFRFPGHEKVKMVDSSLGRIPEGWYAGKLNDILITIESGSRPKGGINAVEREIPSIGAENILGLGKYDYLKEKYVSKDFFNRMGRGHIKDRDVLLYKDGAQIGRKAIFGNGFPHSVCCINEHVFILRVNNQISQSYLYFWLDQPEMTQNIKNLNANSAQPGINQVGVKGLPILIPTKEIIVKFDELCEPLLSELFLLAKENNILRKTRDLLLPRLISGELEVSDMDIETGDDE